MKLLFFLFLLFFASTSVHGQELDILSKDIDKTLLPFMGAEELYALAFTKKENYKKINDSGPLLLKEKNSRLWEEIEGLKYPRLNDFIKESGAESIKVLTIVTAILSNKKYLDTLSRKIKELNNCLHEERFNTSLNSFSLGASITFHPFLQFSAAPIRGPEFNKKISGLEKLPYSEVRLKYFHPVDLENNEEDCLPDWLGQPDTRPYEVIPPLSKEPYSEKVKNNAITFLSKLKNNLLFVRGENSEDIPLELFKLFEEHNYEEIFSKEISNDRSNAQIAAECNMGNRFYARIFAPIPKRSRAKVFSSYLKDCITPSTWDSRSEQLIVNNGLLLGQLILTLGVAAFFSPQIVPELYTEIGKTVLNNYLTFRKVHIAGEVLLSMHVMKTWATMDSNSPRNDDIMLKGSFILPYLATQGLSCFVDGAYIMGRFSSLSFIQKVLLTGSYLAIKLSPPPAGNLGVEMQQAYKYKYNKKLKESKSFWDCLWLGWDASLIFARCFGISFFSYLITNFVPW